MRQTHSAVCHIDVQAKRGAPALGAGRRTHQLHAASHSSIQDDSLHCAQPPTSAQAMHVHTNQTNEYAPLFITLRHTVQDEICSLYGLTHRVLCVETVFLSHLYIKTNSLPGQARDRFSSVSMHHQSTLVSSSKQASGRESHLSADAPSLSPSFSPLQRPANRV
jgi:hypothetical protein